jgi:KTSC domain-containing protein
VNIRMLKVPDSSNVLAIGYDLASSTLRVQFKSGAAYDYANATPHHFAQLASAPSVGAHFAAQLRANAAHPSTRVADPAPPAPGARPPEAC